MNRLRWLKNLFGLITGANSKTETRTEQSEWSRKSERSVEIMVETDEAIFHQADDIGLHDGAPIQRWQERINQAEDSAPKVKKRTARGE